MNPQDVAWRAVGEHGAAQDMWELGQLLALLARNPPKLGVEIGSWSGGSLFAWAELGTEMIAVTLPDHANILRAHGATVLLSDSRHVRGKLDGALAGRTPGFVFIDGDHSAEVCWSDWQLARDIAPGAIIGFHDIANPAWPGTGLVWDHLSRTGHSMTIVNPLAGMGIGLIFT